MSWKLLVSAGLLCIVASPAFAVFTPGLSLTSGGLDASGNWIWNVTVTPTSGLFQNSGPTGTPPNTVGGSIGTELGFAATGSNLVSATKNATNFPNDDPGTPIGAGFPVNTNTTALGVQTLANNASVNLGSTYFTGSVPQATATFTTIGPSTAGSLTSGLGLSGAYSGKGRIAQNGANFDLFSGSASRTAFAGDVNLSGSVTGADLATLAANFGKPGSFTWAGGDFNGSTGGTGEISGADLATLAANFGKSGGSTSDLIIPVSNVGPGAGAGSAVPEPASIVLAALGLLAGVGLIRRK